ncbi:PTS sugar transporter subunit IIB [Vagococcus sp. BWB3-3]|uniref:PTS sugar transporter subunit IIB n=1 Tax=Vagococcus allomyrinae TaxID=2794353 RepID=A0A940SW49_9ENTE|nr:PTS sugar transporter subunit IIB [Vagococcus allomyrinae]MBP1041008.1 PTS sugar transporter subunit IIB [Vagococcus allomyrinae]
MDKITVMLVCGGGASSGFLASSMRKSAKKQQLIMEVFATSESEIDNHVDEIDVLLVGPHLRYLEEEIQEKLAGKDIKLAIIENDIYGSLDGERAVKKVINMMEE